MGDIGSDGDLDANDNITCGDLIVDEADGVINYSGSDSASITVTTPTFLGIETATYEHRYSYTGLSADLLQTTSRVFVQNGQGLVCVGLEVGVQDTGDVEGYTAVGDATDFLRFAIPIPSLWVDSGQTTSLVISFDCWEKASENVDVNVFIYEYGNETPIVTDTLLLTDTDARQWYPLITLATGFGAVATLTGDDAYLTIVLTVDAAGDDFWIYGARLLYQTGLQATQ